MKSKKNNIIRSFTQPIFVPHILYVCKNCTKKYMDKHFEFVDHTSIVEENADQYCATTSYGVRDLKTDKLCIVVQLHDSFVKRAKKDKLEVYNTCAHEAFHVAHEILSYCEVSLSDSSRETYAYMVGWAAECIFKTLIDDK